MDVMAKICDTDGGKAPRIPLNDGNLMPAIGLGTIGFDENGHEQDEEVEKPVTWALNAGYRMIDTASGYENEEDVGRGILNSNVPREQVFIVTKLGLSEQRDVLQSLRGSLKRLNTSYVDLYLISNPIALKPDDNSFDIIDYLDTWKGMEEAKRLGLAKSIGVSNFNISQMERLLSNCEIRPAVLQVEVHLNLAQNELHEFTKRENIALMGFLPFGPLYDKTGVPPPPRIDDVTMVELAKKYKKTVPQIALRYLVQRGISPIPHSMGKEKNEENIDIFDFELTEPDMITLSQFNKNYRVVLPSFWQDHPYYPFERKENPDN
ncbi:aldo-keto reductase AKR2E4-like isoform X2 [Pieris napi]|uniref:aldo-keto reductase AKR2E4-like isoform X2 n=1 Tax=Pieris napi TaxID=78633 RepID=UPI001FBA1068|nr:aldo-keto reductase AKR2E4-like isoform X2 [Pieris napi]